MTDDHVSHLSDDESSDEDVHFGELQGTLSKWTNYLHGWQDRFFVLKEGTLSYYKSETETHYDCRGAISLQRASFVPHEFDDCRFDVRCNDSVWYLRASSVEGRHRWIEMLEIQKAESGYGSEGSLQRHGSMLSITSGTNLSLASTGSFKKGRGLREKLSELETFRDIVCRQVDTLQAYFDTCAATASYLEDGALDDEAGDESGSNSPDDKRRNRAATLVPLVSSAHALNAIDFKGEAITFKATTGGIIACLSHCLDLMNQREEAWRRRLDKEVERRKKMEDTLRLLSHEKTHPVFLGGPDYEEGPYSRITDEEFFDALDAALDKLDQEQVDKNSLTSPIHMPDSPGPLIVHRLSEEVERVVQEHLKYDKMDLDEGVWELIHSEGEMKVYRREVEKDGVVLDPLKAVHVVKGITGHELCHYFFDPSVRMQWEGTLETTAVIEALADDTLVFHQVHKRVWPATQRDACFWSHIRCVAKGDDDQPDWIVVNCSTEHPTAPAGGNKLVRVVVNIAFHVETTVEPPANGKDISRDNITCKITYVANVNPGGWAPASVLRAVCKREYPKFLKRFTQYVKEQTDSKAILF